MTPTDLVAICTLAMLVIAFGCFAVLIGWMVWESLIGPAWRFLIFRWRAWRGRDPDDKWHA